VHPDDQEHARFAFNERRIGDRASTNVEIRLQTKTHGSAISRTGPSSPSSVRARSSMPPPMTDRPTSHFMGTSGVARDITDRKKAEETIAFQAFHDLLTGLPTASCSRIDWAVALTQARRKGKRLGVMFIDIDRFKLVNDTYGHHEGDELLKSFAQRARSVPTLRETRWHARGAMNSPSCCPT
jgi:predicted signal transduction protein with EAL and GGDEF domain